MVIAEYQTIRGIRPTRLDGCGHSILQSWILQVVKANEQNNYSSPTSLESELVLSAHVPER